MLCSWPPGCTRWVLALLHDHRSGVVARYRGPTGQLVAAMLRNQRRELEERPPAPAAQQQIDV